MAKKNRKPLPVAGDRASRRLRVVESIKKLYENYLRQGAGWDGVYPIPFTRLSAKDFDVLANVDILHTSADDNCYWIADPQSAYRLYAEGYSICTDPAVLEKRKAFK